MGHAARLGRAARAPADCLDSSGSWKVMRGIQTVRVSTDLVMHLAVIPANRRTSPECLPRRNQFEIHRRVSGGLDANRNALAGILLHHFRIPPGALLDFLEGIRDVVSCRHDELRNAAVVGSAGLIEIEVLA